MTPAKIDLYKVHKDQYVAPKNPMLLEAKPARYLVITGQGEPGGEEFEARVGALYGVAYTAKMEMKRSGKDHTVCKLEGFWWGSGGEADFSRTPKNQWNWKLAIRTPDFVTDSAVDQAIQTLLGKKKDERVKEVQLETIGEGRCVQMLHVGPYDQEAESIARMKQFATDQGLDLHGFHHEIYLSDPRRVAAEKLRTILRMPVR